MKNFITTSALVFLFLFVLTVHACGCGVLINHNTSSKWSYGNDSAEKSFINYQNGIEKLIISLDISPSSADSFFVVPVPGKASEVHADILSDTPRLSLNFNVKEKTIETLNNSKIGIFATQIYPILFFGLNNEVGAPPRSGGEGSFGASPLTNAYHPTVTVYQHLEKNGMTAEVLSAETPDALYDYFSGKGLKVEKNSIPIFRDYIKKDFTFVASWISIPGNNVSARGISMNFPTKEIYYPLKPGSAYTGEGTLKEIFVMGQVTPKLFGILKDSASADYFYHLVGDSLADNARTDDSIKQLNNFFAPYTDSDKFGLTRVSFKAKPETLTEDLYFSNSAPFKVLVEDFFAFHPFIAFLILLLPFTLLVLYLSKKIWRIQMTNHQFIKLWILSWFTIIGTIIGSHFLPAKKFKFIATYSILFIILISIFAPIISGIF